MTGTERDAFSSADERIGFAAGYLSRHLIGICLLLCVLGVILSFIQIGLTRRPEIRVQSTMALFDQQYQNFGDIKPSLRAAEILARGRQEPVYDTTILSAGAFIYPPLAAAFFDPFLRLRRSSLGSTLAKQSARFAEFSEEQLALSALSIINRVLIVAIFLLLLSFLTYRVALRIRMILAVLVALVFFYPLLHGMMLNQAALLQTFLLGIVWVVLQRKNYPVAGIALAIAGIIKPQILLVLPFFLFCARPVVTWTIGTTAVLLVLSILYAGLANHVLYVTKMLPLLSTGYAFYPNQSFNGLLNRLFLDVPIGEFALAPKSSLVKILTIAFGLITYGAALWVGWRQRLKKNMAVPLFGFAWLITAIITPISWEHHYIPSIFVFVWIYRQYAWGREQPKPQLLLLTTVAFVLIANYFDVFDVHGLWLRLLVSYVFYGGLILAGTLMSMLNRQQEFV